MRQPEANPNNPSVESRLRDRFRFLQKDFLQTEDDLWLAVLDHGIESNRVWASLRYQAEAKSHREPDDSDGALSAPRPLRKLSTSEAESLVRKNHPDWLVRSERHDAVLVGVPTDSIITHLRPNQLLTSQLGAQADGESEQPSQYAKRQHALETLRSILVKSVSQSEWGVTGSLLVGTGHSGSDIDLVVYGLENFRTCQATFVDAIRGGRLESLSEAQWRETFARRGCALNFDEYVWHERRKHNKFSLLGVKVDLSCVDFPHDWAAARGEKRERIAIRTRVTDATYAFASPAVYLIDHPSIAAVLACTPTYTGQAANGEEIEIAGWLEDCEGGRRIIVGSSREAPTEYIKVVPKLLT